MSVLVLEDMCTVEKMSRILMRNITIVVIILVAAILVRAYVVATHSAVFTHKKYLIPRISIQQLLTAIHLEKKIVLVDAREASEFDEEHIPGAINIPLRDIATTNLAKLKSAKMVVAYCMKDFRGFEAAKAFAFRGLTNVYLLDPSGLAGWKALGLPTRKSSVMGQEKSKQGLLSCHQNLKKCLQKEQ